MVQDTSETTYCLTECFQCQCLLSGFGPFGNHTVNASWVAVQELALMGIANDVELITIEIPVEYDTVRVLVPELWNKYKPKVGR